MNTKSYKIRSRLCPQMFSTGGNTPRWTKTGKVWRSRQALKSHIAMLKNSERWFEYRNGYRSSNWASQYLDEAQVVEYDMVEFAAYDVDSLMELK